MTIQKKDVVLDTTTTSTTVQLGNGVVRVLKVSVIASADTTVSLAVTDSLSETIATIASADYTTRTHFYLTPLETRSFDSGGDAMIDAEGPGYGIVCESPLTVAATGLGSGDFTVTFYYDA